MMYDVGSTRRNMPIDDEHVLVLFGVSNEATAVQRSLPSFTLDYRRNAATRKEACIHKIRQNACTVEDFQEKFPNLNKR